MAGTPILRAPLTFKVHLQVSRRNYMSTERLLQDCDGVLLHFLGALLLLGNEAKMAFCRPTGLLVVVSSQTMVKKVFGSRFAIALSYFVAVGFIVVGSIAMTGGLMTLCKRMGYCSRSSTMGEYRADP